MKSVSMLIKYFITYINTFYFYSTNNFTRSTTIINIHIKYRASKIHFSQFPQINIFNILIYIKIKNYNFRRNYNIIYMFTNALHYVLRLLSYTNASITSNMVYYMEYCNVQYVLI